MLISYLMVLVISSIYDKSAGREVVPAGASANRFIIFDDVPFFWGA